MRRAAILLSMAACAAAGALGSEALRAQARPPGYVVVEVDVKDLANFLKNFSPLVGDVIESKGGQYLARGGRVETVEGSKSGRMVLLKFESFEKAVAAFKSKDYADIRTIGDRYGKFRIVAMEGRPS